MVNKILIAYLLNGAMNYFKSRGASNNLSLFLAFLIFSVFYVSIFLIIITSMIYHCVFNMISTKMFIHFFHNVLPIFFALFFETCFLNWLFNRFTSVTARTFLNIIFIIQFALYFILNGKIFS